MPSLLSELKRRNVLRIAAAYSLVAWIIIEAGSVLLPTFGAPEWAFRIYVLAVLGGFVIAIVVTWIFEITPDGVKLDKNVDPNIQRDPQSKQRMNFLLIAGLVLALGISITFNISGIRNSETGPDDNIEASIAVLPFESVGVNPDNELFADGMHDDLLTRLANIAALKVISRTSVMEYRETTKNIGEIGAELGVRTILEGTVRRSGNTVRINLQLVDVENDDYLWADSYDRDLTTQGIFGIQTDIADQVASALQATLTPSEQVRVASVPTDHMQAYNLVIEGRNNLYKRRLDATLAALQQFQQAIDVDPDYADAYAGLATTTMLLWINHGHIAQGEAYSQTEAALNTALELNPELADAYATYGLLRSNQYSSTRRGDENIEAEEYFRHAIALNPNHASAYMWFASLRNDEGRIDEAIELYVKSMELDPLGRIPRSNLPGLYAQRGESELAIAQWLDAARLHPDWPTPSTYLGAHLFGLGRLDEAMAWHEKAREMSDDPFIGGNLGVGIYIEFGDVDRALEMLQQLPDGHPMEFVIAAFRLMIIGDLTGSLTEFTELIDSGADIPFFILDVASTVAIMVGDFDTALRLIQERDPVLTGDTALNITQYSWPNAIKLAFIHLQNGERRRATRILTATLSVIETLPRLGTAGHGIADVQIYALLGRKEDAIQALSQAVDDGFRSEVSYNLWTLDYDPYLDNLRDDRRFVELQATIDADIETMRDRVALASETGEWQPLRDVTIAN